MEYFEEQEIKNKQFEDVSYENLEFVECNFTGCQFLNVKLKNCKFKNCRFNNCVLGSISFMYCEAKHLEFINSVLIGIIWNDLKTKGIETAIFRSMKSCTIKYNYFTNLKLVKYDFSGSQFDESYFEECKLTDSKFNGVNLHGTKFIRCDLSGADFRDALEYVIDIADNKLKNAKFSFPEVVSLLSSLNIIID